MECGKLKVPLDYSHPNGKKIDLGVSRIASKKPGKRRGILLSNPGGPGGPGLDMPQFLATIMPQDILDSYDLIGMDPRFIGTSTPITCGLSALDADQAFITLTQQKSFDKTAAFVQRVAKDCQAKGGDKLPYATTANTARDMDMIRKALGEPKLSYFGYSYGTYLGAVYTSLFPKQSDRIILDSNVDPKAVWRQQFRDWGASGDIRFPDFAKYLTDNDDLFHLGTTDKQIQAKYNELLDKLDKHPLTLEDGTILNGAYFRRVTFGGLYSDASFLFGGLVWMDLDAYDPAAATTAANTVASLKQPLSMLQAPAADTSEDIPVDNPSASGLAIVCGDAQWSRSVGVYRRDLQADIAKHPMFGELGSNISPCAFWQAKSAKPVQISSSGKRNVLLIQNRRDPATPYFSGQSMRKTLGERARMVSVDQGGHAVAYIEGNSCADNTVTNYLVNGTLPKVDIDCADETQATHEEAAPTTLRASVSNVDAKQTARQGILRRMLP
jgi:pimeloyl-ACP methyl ester carboxylesterase